MDANEKSRRLLEAAFAALRLSPNNKLNVVVLNKVLFYFDLVFLRDVGEVYTHNTFIGLPQGPVVAKYDSRLVGELEKQGIATQVSEWNAAKPLVLVPDVVERIRVDDSIEKAIKPVVEFFSGCTSREASEYSHENIGWLLSRRNPKPSPIDMTIAMQQILEVDSWMKNDDVDWEAIEMADSVSGEEW